MNKTVYDMLEFGSREMLIFVKLNSSLNLDSTLNESNQT